MLLQSTSLEKYYGKRPVVKKVSIEVNRGEIVGLLGPNGAGKTTLLRALSGLNKPTSGVVNWMGQAITGEKPENLVRMGISHVSEGKSVIPELTVKENLELGAIWRKNSREMRESMDQVVQIFPRLGERISQRSDTLSGGERQMLAIGRAAVGRPGAGTADLPTGVWRAQRQPDELRRQPEPVPGADRPLWQLPH